MRGGFEKQVNNATRLSETDPEGSRQQRREVSEQVGLRAHLLHLLTTAPLDSELLRITPYGVVEGGEGREEAG